MSKVLEFKDFGFKLAVINKLMYIDDIITPKLEARSFIENVRGLKKGEGYDIIEEEGYEIIPEIKEYFEKLEITESLVKDITELSSDGGDDIYGEIIPFWDGEDDVYDIKSAEDVRLLPALKKATLLFNYPGTELIQEFKNLGVELDSN